MNLMKTKTKFAFSTLAFFALVIVACLVCLNLYSANKSSSTQDNLKTATVSNGATITSSAETSSVERASASATSTSSGYYRNTEYGFSLSFDEQWQGYSVEKAATTGNSIAKIQFKIPNVSEPPLSIYVFSKESFNENDLTTIHATKISSSNKYVFAYASWDTSPPEGTLITDKSVVKLIESFKLI